MAILNLTGLSIVLEDGRGSAHTIPSSRKVVVNARKNVYGTDPNTGLPVYEIDDLLLELPEIDSDVWDMIIVEPLVAYFAAKEGYCQGRLYIPVEHDEHGIYHGLAFFA